MKVTPRIRAVVALLSSVPLMSIGATMALIVAPGRIGQSVLVTCYLLLLSMPIVWRRWVERKRFSIARPTLNDGIVGGVVGLLMALVILVAYKLVLQDWIDGDTVRSVLARVGGLDKFSFVLSGIYFSFVNALVEEYFWRWFVFSRCEEVVPGRVAVLLSALFFTVHHTIGLAAFAVGWRVVLVGSLAVFVAGASWSETYRRRRSVWSGYVSHAIADIALHIVAWQVFF